MQQESTQAQWGRPGAGLDRRQGIGRFAAAGGWIAGILALLLPVLAALALLAAPAGVQAAAAPATQATPAAPAASATAVALEVFVREGCPHCAEAKIFLADLQQRRPGLTVRLRPIDRDPDAREALMQHSRAAGIWPPGVPTFVVHGQWVRVGFDDAAHRGRELEDLLDAPVPAPAAPSEPDTPPASAPDTGVLDTALGTLSASRLGLPLFTLALGLLDGFNPCAMWVLLFLLALLARLRDRRRMALIAGTFVAASGAVYYAFLAAWLNLFLAVGLSQTVLRGLGLLALVIAALNLKDFFAWGRGPSLSIPAAAKPGLYARMRGVLQAPGLGASLLGAAALAVAVNFVELLCTAGLPAIYTAVLAQQQLSALAHHAYLGLYIVGYLADDALMVTLAVLALGSGKLDERHGRWLKALSGTVMLLLGLALLARPQWLF
ncbi:MAG: glutaredoxin family protein [Burkholderiaceae bacterium]|nr:glutaredoxin family protein [Burkholderiaceae bacterium]